MYELSLNNVLLVDVKNAVHKQCSIGIENKKIVEISENSLEAKSIKSINLSGKVAVPGIIDVHVHITPIFGGSLGGLYMLSKAGVCTAVDLAGPADVALKIAAEHGSGMNIAILESVRPLDNLSSQDVCLGEMRTFVKKSLESGAIGCKLLGGHYPLTPEASRYFVQAAAEENAYAAWHAGSTENINTLESFTNLVEWTGEYRLHAAHINTYCRGLQDTEINEAQQAVKLLEEHPNIYSEAYLAQTNGINFQLNEKGQLKSRATGQTLNKAGYEDSKQGIINALRDGFAHVFAPKGIETGIYYGEEAIELLLKNNCEIAGGFDVNPPLSRLLVCLSKRKNGNFAVDAISTDGGAIPRNVIVSHGLSLVRMGMLSLEDFVYKTSYMPAKMLGLHNKGHLAPGADADITVLDFEKNTPVLTVVNGQVNMYEGVVFGNSATVITTEKGAAAVKSFGLPPYVVQGTDFLPKRK